MLPPLVHARHEAELESYLKRQAAVIAVPALAFIVLSAIDIVREEPPWDPVEIALDIAEQGALVLMVIAIVWSLQRISHIQRDQDDLRQQMARQTAKGEEWRKARAAEIGAMQQAIEREFKAWGLTTAEIDIANLLLKGASMKEIAVARETSEATIRQQSQSVYRKAGLSGRAELSAYFLDGLFERVERDNEGQIRVVD